MSPLGEYTSIARMHPAIRCPGSSRCLWILIVPDEHARTTIHDLAVLGNFHLDARRRWTDGVRLNVVIGLHAAINARLGLAVELLQIDAQRAEEHEDVRADRLTGRVG